LLNADEIKRNSADVSTDSPVSSVGKSVEDITSILFKNAEVVNGLPQISMSELIKRTKGLGFSSSTNPGI
jgi:hypothetical protein